MSNDGERVYIAPESADRDLSAELAAAKHFAKKKSDKKYPHRQKEHPGHLKRPHRASVAGSRFAASELRNGRRGHKIVEQDVPDTRRLSRKEKKSLRAKWYKEFGKEISDTLYRNMVAEGKW